MSFGIASELLQVRLVPHHGEPFPAGLFVRQTGTASGEPETVLSRLNESGDAFLPVAVGDALNGLDLVQLGAIDRIECTEPMPEVEHLRAIGALEEPVEILFASGDTVRGTLLMLSPRNDRRLSDLLNRSDPFVLVVNGQRTLYVRRGAILRVRPIG